MVQAALVGISNQQRAVTNSRTLGSQARIPAGCEKPKRRSEKLAELSFGMASKFARQAQHSGMVVFGPGRLRAMRSPLSVLDFNDRSFVHEVPREMGWLRCAVDFFIFGRWVRAHTRFDDFPDESEYLNDMQKFYTIQNNISLLSALWISVQCDQLYNYADARLPIGALLSIGIWSCILLLTAACFWAVVITLALSQADTLEEERLALHEMGWRAGFSTQLFVWSVLVLIPTQLFYWYVVLEYGNPTQMELDPLTPPNGTRAHIFSHFLDTTEEQVVWGACIGQLVISASFLIYNLPRMVQIMYQTKRQYKLRLRAQTAPDEAEAVKTALAHELVISATQLQTDLEEYLNHTGFEHADVERFLRFLFRKHKPAHLSWEQQVLCRFAPVTKRRAVRALENAIDDALDAERRSQGAAINVEMDDQVGASSSLEPVSRPTTSRGDGLPTSETARRVSVT